MATDLCAYKLYTCKGIPVTF